MIGAQATATRLDDCDGDFPVGPYGRGRGADLATVMVMGRTQAGGAAVEIQLTALALPGGKKCRSRS